MYDSYRKLVDRFKALFPDWEQCPECENMFPKKQMKWCAWCNKTLCQNCHRGHQINKI